MRKYLHVRRLREDIAVVFERDPAARTTWEVVTCYPGLHALVWHRNIAHPLWRAGYQWLARWLAHWGRWATGIEIHSGERSAAACSSITGWESSSVKPR